MCHITVLSDTKVKAARKDYGCDACTFVRENLGELDKGILTFAERRLVIMAKWDGWKILKGQPYEKQYNVMDGDTYTFRSRPEMNKLCHKYELYPEC